MIRRPNSSSLAMTTGLDSAWPRHNGRPGRAADSRSRPTRMANMWAKFDDMNSDGSSIVLQTRRWSGPGPRQNSSQMTTGLRSWWMIIPGGLAVEIRWLLDFDGWRTGRGLRAGYDYHWVSMLLDDRLVTRLGRSTHLKAVAAGQADIKGWWRKMIVEIFYSDSIDWVWMDAVDHGCANFEMKSYIRIQIYMMDSSKNSGCWIHIYEIIHEFISWIHLSVLWRILWIMAQVDDGWILIN